MSVIRVPVCVHQITLVIDNSRIVNNVRVGDTVRVASTWTEGYFDRVFDCARRIWQSARIDFYKQSFAAGDAELRNANVGNRVSTVNQEDLCFRFQPSAGVSVILVNEAVSRDAAAGVIGGVAFEAFRSCVLANSGAVERAGAFLAHELGHLLGLPDIRTGLGDNLMYGGISNDTRLTDDQRRRAHRRAQLLIQSRN